MALLFIFGANAPLWWAMQRVTSATAALLSATLSFWIVLFDWWAPGGKRPALRVLAGLAMGFAGLVWLVYAGSPSEHKDFEWIGPLAIIFGMMCWGWASIFSKRLKPVGGLVLTAGANMLVGSVPVLVLGLWMGEGQKLNFHNVPLLTWVSFFYQVLICSALAQPVYFWLLRSARSTTVATYPFVVPVVAFILGWITGDEFITWQKIGAGIVIIFSAVLAMSEQWGEKK